MALSSPQVYTDISGLNDLKVKARADQKGSIKEVAQQFESLFVHMMLKSMRDASLGEGIFDSKQSEFYRDMYDQQMSIHFSERGGIGLADVLERQLGGGPGMGVKGRTLDDYVSAPIGRSPGYAAKNQAVEKAHDQALGESPMGFINALWPSANKAAEKLGLPTEALIAQAALETGWGRHVMHKGGGENSHNLFGIKANKGWMGDTVEVTTHEYKDGRPFKMRDDFRSYGSYDESFNDYVNFISGNSRYKNAVNAAQDANKYFEELQKAGYATDPNYAKKNQAIMQLPEMQSVRQAKADGLEKGSEMGGARNT